MYSHIHSKWFPNDSILSNFHLNVNFHENSNRLSMLHADRHIEEQESGIECQRRVCRSVKDQRRESKSETAMLASNALRQAIVVRADCSSSVRTSHASLRFVRLSGMWNVCGLTVCSGSRSPTMLLDLLQLRLIRGERGDLVTRKGLARR